MRSRSHLPRRGLLAAILALLAAGALAAPRPEAPRDLLADPAVTVAGPRPASGSAGRPNPATDGDVADYGPSHGFVWAPLRTPMLLTLPRAETLNKVDVLLLDVDGRSYDFRLEVSPDGNTFQSVGERARARGWQSLAFPATECRALRLVFTGTTVPAGSYHVVEIAAWHQPDPEQPSPLRRAFDERPRHRAVDRAERLALQPLAQAVFGNAAAMERLRAAPEKQAIGFSAGAQRVAAWREPGMVVAVLDEDGDMSAGDPAADTDSDCWAADYGADGVIDRVVDYEDRDRDGDPDYMVIYGLTANHWSNRDMTCVVISDLDDDNKLWHLVRYEYRQGTCQWLCDFIGDEYFAMGRFDERSGRWVSLWENPFCFYDTDRDGAPEVAVRYSGTDLRLRSLRYSFDADNDSSPTNPKDYDFSLTALGDVQAPADSAEEYPLRGGGILRYVSWKESRRVAETSPWKRVMLAWDELDNNVNEASATERQHERWEGVIAHGSPHFPQEGGPPISPRNTRYEVDNDFSGGMRLYYSEVDRRIHLRGAEFGWIDVDYNHDRRVDLRLRFEDSDNNGFFDTWKVDADGDGAFERVTRVADEGARPVPLTEDALRAAHAGGLTLSDGDNELAMADMARLLAGWRSPIARYWESLEHAYYAGAKIRASAEGRRYYADLIRESSYARLRQQVSAEARAGLDSAYLAGFTTLSRALAGVKVEAPRPVSLAVDLVNPLPVARKGEAVVLPLAQFPDLRQAVGAGGRLVVRDAKGTTGAVQADDLDDDGVPDELVFLADVPADGKARVTVETSKTNGLIGTAANPDMGASIGWESELVAYRTYYGKIDYFGKKRPILKLHELQGAYHRDSEWGMDVLHIGRGTGAGGLYVQVGERALPFMNEEGEPENVEIARRVVATGPVRTTIEVTLAGKTPELRGITAARRFSICGNDLHTTERLTVAGGARTVSFAPGVLRLGAAPPAQSLAPPIGYLGVWGKQDHRDVAEAGPIGMGILFPTSHLVKTATTDLDHLVWLKAESGRPVTLYLVADWAKGGRFADAAAWQAGLEALARRLAAPIQALPAPGRQ